MVRTLGCLSALCLLGWVACVWWIVAMTGTPVTGLRQLAGLGAVVLPVVGIFLAIAAQKSDG